MRQITQQILMVRPANFGYNLETAVNNAFQSADGMSDPALLQKKAIEEFDGMVALLKEKGISVTVVEDTAQPVKPDAVFPNNWVSFHETGFIITYPMFAPNRRLERREDVLAQIGKKFKIENRYSFEFYEEEKPPLFLEGTGSLVLDRTHHIAYACISPRTDASLVDRFCTLTGMKPCLFLATDRNGGEIYHTNVMMAIGIDFAVVCLESVQSETQRNQLVESLTRSGKKIIAIDLMQMEHFAGNMLEVEGREGARYLCLSSSAMASLREEQIAVLASLTNLLVIPIPNIEKAGGGSVRCMMAEIFLQPK